MKRITEPSSVLLILSSLTAISIFFGENLTGACAIVGAVGFLSFTQWLDRQKEDNRKQYEDRIKTLERRLENIETKQNFQ